MQGADQHIWVDAPAANVVDAYVNSLTKQGGKVSFASIEEFNEPLDD